MTDKLPFKERALEYYRDYHRKRRLDPLEREKDNLRQKERRSKNPEKYREINRISERKRKLKKYGFTENEYINKLHSQNNRCKICNSSFPGGKHDWHVDHCHTTGKIRGILCHHCNLLLGNAKDDIDVLRKAIEYLKEYSNVE